MTKRDHLKTVAKMSGQPPIELLEAEELPPLVAHIWDWWLDLNSERSSNGYGPNPINSTMIKDWAEMSGNEPEPWEVAAIKAVDRIFLNRKENK